MSLPSLLNHLFNFLLPALALGLLMAAFAPLLMKNARPQGSWFRQGLLNALVSALALVAGLWLFGHDGKMATYSAMVMACATCQWLAARAWR